MTRIGTAASQVQCRLPFHSMAGEDITHVIDPNLHQTQRPPHNQDRKEKQTEKLLIILIINSIVCSLILNSQVHHFVTYSTDKMSLNLITLIILVRMLHARIMWENLFFRILNEESEKFIHKTIFSRTNAYH